MDNAESLQQENQLVLLKHQYSITKLAVHQILDNGIRMRIGQRRIIRLDEVRLEGPSQHPFTTCLRSRSSHHRKIHGRGDDLLLMDGGHLMESLCLRVSHKDSLYYNYEGFYSAVLIGLVDAVYKFI
ncbi:hypothetical protein MAR_036748 [Mya arenaria]|uniref:Uncharacterized protein n=1 Tax=Mya arenaria TaxID=6604 RepID=A0ABY7FPJ4_MYAAR|nr:hypothetical protein MAR_036748 [Mya arenaria]